MNARVLTASVTLAALAACTESAPNAPFHAAVAPAPAPGSLFLYPERIPLEDGGFVEAERGIIFAPVNRADPASGVLGVEVYRFRAQDGADPSTPPVFLLHGGPSFPGLEGALSTPGRFEDRYRPFTEVADLIVVGQRGIGSSKPTTTVGFTPPDTPPDRPVDTEAVWAGIREDLAAERAHWEDRGLDLAGFTALEAAEDVNEVRQAFGYDKIIVWGGSFGSHWGMTLMRAHPEIVERAVLWGMEGPDHTYDHPGHLWNVYRRVAEEAESAPELRGRIPDGGLVAAFEEVVRSADANPRTVPVVDPDDGNTHDVLIDGDAVRRLARGFSTGLAGWPADVIEMSEGDFERAARALYARSRGGRSFMTASFFQLDCGSGITPERLEEQLADPANALIADMNAIYIEGCPAWDSDLGDGFRQNFETTIPTVIAHGTWDTSTPYENALELVPYFQNSRFVTVLRGPHGIPLGASEAFDAGIWSFVASGDWSELPDTVELPRPDFRVPDSRPSRR